MPDRKQHAFFVYYVCLRRGTRHIPVIHAWKPVEGDNAIQIFFSFRYFTRFYWHPADINLPPLASLALSCFPHRAIYIRRAARKLSHLSSLASRLGSFLSRSLSLWPSGFFVLDFDLASLLATLCSPPRSVTTTTAVLSLQDCVPETLEDVGDDVDAARLLV